MISTCTPHGINVWCTVNTCTHWHQQGSPQETRQRETPTRETQAADGWMPTCATEAPGPGRGDTASRARRGDEASTKRHRRYHKHSSNFSCPESHCARPPRGNQRLRQHKSRSPALGTQQNLARKFEVFHFGLNERNLLLEAIIFDDLLGGVEDGGTVNAVDVLGASFGSKHRQDPGAAPNIQHNLATKQVRVVDDGVPDQHHSFHSIIPKAQAGNRGRAQATRTPAIRAPCRRT